MSSSRELLQTLVGFDTTSRESNLQLIEYVRDYLAGFGVTCELVYNEERSKANLFASIGPAELPGLCCRGTPMWCRWTANRGPCRPSR
jgi:acetylornithine deacetylase